MPDPSSQQDPHLAENTRMSLFVALQIDRPSGVETAMKSGLIWEATFKEAVSKAIFYGSHKSLAVLLDQKGAFSVDLDALLIEASIKDHKATVELLLKRGADLHVKDDAAFCVACREGNMDAVKLLLAKGAHVRAQNDAPLYDAMSSDWESSWKHKWIIEHLARALFSKKRWEGKTLAEFQSDLAQLERKLGQALPGGEKRRDRRMRALPLLKPYIFARQHALRLAQPAEPPTLPRPPAPMHVL